MGGNGEAFDSRLPVEYSRFQVSHVHIIPVYQGAICIKEIKNIPAFPVPRQSRGFDDVSGGNRVLPENHGSFIDSPGPPKREIHRQRFREGEQGRPAGGSGGQRKRRLRQRPEAEADTEVGLEAEGSGR